MAVIRITEYLRPNGRKIKIPVDIPDELKEIADKLTISCEALPDMHVMIYAHRKGERAKDELTELAGNGPGENTPQIALERLIRRFQPKPFKPFLED